MAKRDKLLEKWRNNTPKEAPVSEVEAVVNYYFRDSRVKGRRGSHNIVVKDERFKGIGEFGALGRLEIPVKSGQKIKGIYLQKIVRAIDILLETEELN